jgi:hypothetical protein
MALILPVEDSILLNRSYVTETYYKKRKSVYFFCWFLHGSA